MSVQSNVRTSKAPATLAQGDAPAEAGAPLRFVSAASLFDGHDAAINIIRRLLQSHGAEVVHLGHNRSVADIVRAAIQEDADGIACSSYQGGHNEYFRYMVDMLREQGADHIRIVVGGGGTIAPHEVAELEAYGVERIYTPEDGRKFGLDGMINDVFARVRKARKPAFEFGPVGPRDHKQIARTISALEQDEADEALSETLKRAVARSTRKPPVIGITGTGGAGKSSLTDELLMRFVRHFPDRNVAVVAMDPTRRRSGGALLGDRIRMNSLASEQVFMRSLATRRAHLATSAVLADVLNLLKYAGFDLIVIETAGIGQSDSEIVDLVDVPMYVMTSEYGAASQLEKIDMLDFAELIALNKFEKRGAEDALRDVRKQWRRNRVAFTAPDEQVPVYPTIASRFNDPGVNKLFAALCARLDARTGETGAWHVADPGPTELVERHALVPAQRARYLAEISGNGRRARDEAQHRAAAASRAHSLYEALRTLEDNQLPAPLERYPGSRAQRPQSEPAMIRLRGAYNDALDAVGIEGVALLRQWPAQAKSATDDQYVYTVRGREIRGDNYVGTLSHNKVPKLAVPQFADWGEQLTFLLKENLPGQFPYTAGVYPVPARGRGSDAHVRGRGRSGAHQSSLPLRRGRSWRRAPLDGVRFDDVVWRGSGSASGHLRTHRQLRCLDRNARRHEEAVLGLRSLRAHDFGLDDDQRARADDPRNVHEHGHRPARRATPARDRSLARSRAHDRQPVRRARATRLQGRAATEPRRLGPRAARHHRRPAPRPRDVREDSRGNAGAGARHGAGGHPQGGPGAEHLHFLDGIRAAHDGRRAAVLHRTQRAQFLFGVDLGLSHRRGWRESGVAARVHACQWVHDRRVLPGARHEGGRVRAEPVVLLLEWHGSGIRGDRPRGASHLGPGHARPVSRRAARRRC